MPGPEVGALRNGKRSLVADLGGTHLRCGLYEGGCVVKTWVGLWTEIDSVGHALKAFLGAGAPPEAGCLAIAAPVFGSRARLTNAGITVDSDELRSELGMQSLLLVNDVAALARSVAVLNPDQSISLGGDPLCPEQPIAVVAPGTGLGVAAYFPTSQRPIIVSSEGGHVPLPATPLGIDVARALLAERGHVTAEDFVSGAGLSLLDATVRRLHGETDPKARTGPEITASGDERTLAIFVDLLAAVAQSHALTFAARGGVLLGGGFLGTLVPVLQELGLRERFVRHEKMGALLESIPLVVDVRDQAALVGAGLFLDDAS